MPDYASDYMRDRGHSCKKSDQGMGKEFVAGATITQGTFVMFSGADDVTVIPCTAAGPLIGVAMDSVVVDETIEVQMDGYHWIQIETALGVDPGDWIMAGNNGMGVLFTCPAAGNNTVIGGLVLSTADADEDCVCLKVQPKVACSIQRG